MKNKVLLKKYLFKVLVFVVFSLFIFLLINIYEYHVYTKNFNIKINSIVSSLQNEYPKITEKEIIEILNSKESIESDTLKKYGISLNDKSIVMENDEKYHEFLIINILIFSLSIGILIILFIMYLKTRDKEINDIINYIEQINKKNYSLKIDSNSEDELSILKNEIYKTTVMLKETTEVAKNDKMNLKKSLEDISHQLKTPLTSILVMLDNLIDDPNMDIKVREDFIKDIKRNIVNINFLVLSLLKLSKFDINAINFKKEEILVKDIIIESTKNVAILCDLKNIKVNIKGDNECKIYCDFKWQVEALTNIFKNCVEYSLENSKIDVVYEQNNVYVKITIIDYGESIDKEEIAHIFERFYKGKNSSSDSMGIGLALAKTIIENDNGIIYVESSEKQTKFIIKYFKI